MINRYTLVKFKLGSLIFIVVRLGKTPKRVKPLTEAICSYLVEFFMGGISKEIVVRYINH